MSDDVWVPTSTIDPNWELVTDPQPCRHGCGGQGPSRGERRVCGRPSVARVSRSYTFGDRQSQTSMWWHYCERHLGGQRIRDGILETRTVPVKNLKGQPP